MTMSEKYERYILGTVHLLFTFFQTLPKWCKPENLDSVIYSLS
jgi:hypothetical protein